MTVSSAGPAAATSADILNGETRPGSVGPDVGRVAPRFPASLVPAITGVRILPGGVTAKLVNISTSGVLVECQERLRPGSAVTVLFAGSFRPSGTMSRVARASVSGIGPDGTLRYHIGIAFLAPIALPTPSAGADAGREASPPLPPTPAPAPPQAPPRNRW